MLEQFFAKTFDLIIVIAVHQGKCKVFNFPRGIEGKRSAVKYLIIRTYKKKYKIIFGLSLHMAVGFTKAFCPVIVSWQSVLAMDSYTMNYFYFFGYSFSGKAG